MEYILHPFLFTCISDLYVTSLKVSQCGVHRHNIFGFLLHYSLSIATTYYYHSLFIIPNLKSLPWLNHFTCTLSYT